MNAAFFYKTLTSKFPFNPTVKQDIFFQKIAEFLTNKQTG